MSILLGEPLVPLLAYTMVQAVVAATEIIRYVESWLVRSYCTAVSPVPVNLHIT